MTATDPRIRTLDEAELLCRAQGGSADSFGVLVKRYEPRLLRYLTGLTGRVQDAEDLTQETFVRALGSLHRYQPGRPFATWLFTIAVRLAATHQRKLGRQTLVAELDPPERSSSDPALAAAEASGRENLWASAQRVLGRRQYTAIWLRYAEEMSVAQVATALGLSGLHVRVLLHRARKKLLHSPEIQRAIRGDFPGGRP
jgi:RNA polymerase sigma-70 factor (ECF subfamily)